MELFNGPLKNKGQKSQFWYFSTY